MTRWYTIHSDLGQPEHTSSAVHMRFKRSSLLRLRLSLLQLVRLMLVLCAKVAVVLCDCELLDLL